MTSTRPTLLPPLSRRVRHIAARKLHGLRPGDRELPTYFIVGVKRGGTTSFDEYLVDHPLVLRGMVEKGSRYYDVNYERGERWFHSHLPLRRDVDRLERRLGTRPVLGESSPYYCFHPDAPGRIAADVPDARLFMVLRDPVQRAWSHYRYEVARGFEHLEPMAALAAEAERVADPDETRRWFAHRHYGYVARSQYADQLRRLYRHFAPEQVQVVASEDLFEQPAQVMARAFAHLGLPAHDAADYRAHKALGDSAVPKDFAEAVRADLMADRVDLECLLETPASWS